MKKIVSITLAVCLILLATSCNLIVKNNKEDQYDYPVTVGNIVFDKAPENVVVLSDNLADIILSCGYEGKLSGRSDSCTQDGLDILPSVGTPDSPDIDKLKELKTTLVLSDESLDDKTKQSIDTMGAELLIIKPAANNVELNKLYSNVASILGGSYSGKMKAMTTVDSIQSQLDSIKSEILDRNIVSTVCYIYDVEGDQCRVAYGKNYIAQLFDYAQLTNIAAEDDDGYIGIDTLLKGNPDNIFCDEGVAEKLINHEDLKALFAVTNGNVYTLPRKYLTLQGNTRLLTVDYLVAKTHDFYTQKEVWPEEFTVEEVVEPEYVAPFEPKEGIFYTIGESYSPIRHIEERLISLGYMNGEADENFTQETADAVAQFQNINGLEQTGIADYNTLMVLLSNDAIPSSN